ELTSFQTLSTSTPSSTTDLSPPLRHHLTRDLPTTSLPSKLDLPPHVTVSSTSRSPLYAVLPRLVRDGLARSRRVTQVTRPDKQLYRITPEGRRTLDEWFETIEPGARETVLLKVFLGKLTAPEVLLEHLDQFRSDVEARLE